ncbi:MAG: hypothetical protein ACOYYS_23600 [Chloroflexota bacterium]
MRITHDMLLKVAQDTVEQRTRANRLIVSAYLSGSILEQEPLIGNTTDIDLFFIRDDEVTVAREIVRITDDVHLDITNAPRRAYRQVRELRSDAWSGPVLYGCRILYDPQHFLDFVQASVRGQFERPDHVLERARPLAEQARQIWFSFDMGAENTPVEQVSHYLRALEYATNSIAVLTGVPLTERRFLLDFPARAQAVGRAGLMAGLVGLLGGSSVDLGALQGMVEDWKMAFETAQKYSPPPAFAATRKHYYGKAVDAFVAGQQPNTALWPLLNTWTRMMVLLPTDAPAYRAWQDACRQLSLLGEAFSEKIEALDAFLDMVEETMEQWAQANGA